MLESWSFFNVESDDDVTDDQSFEVNLLNSTDVLIRVVDKTMRQFYNLIVSVAV